MTTLTVSDQTYNEISVNLKRLGREINDGKGLTLERGDAIIPPRDFRMVAIRQNCLMAAAEVFKNTDGNINDFIDIAEQIFKWTLDGREVDKEIKKDTKENPNSWTVNK